MRALTYHILGKQLKQKHLTITAKTLIILGTILYIYIITGLALHIIQLKPPKGLEIPTIIWATYTIIEATAYIKLRKLNKQFTISAISIPAAILAITTIINPNLTNTTTPIITIILLTSAITATINFKNIKYPAKTQNHKIQY